jgi:hypothetical protein
MKNTTIKSIALGTGVAAAAAGIYFLYGAKGAAKNRRKIKAWTFKAKGEILEQFENLSEMSEEAYHKIIKEVSDRYQAAKNINKKDIAEFVSELKSYWKNISKEIVISSKK